MRSPITHGMTQSSRHHESFWLRGYQKRLLLHILGAFVSKEIHLTKQWWSDGNHRTEEYVAHVTTGVGLFGRDAQAHSVSEKTANV